MVKIFTLINSQFNWINKQTIQMLLADLPTDGLWTIKYSICPNAELYVEYTFLRNVKQLIKYHSLFCQIEIDRCNKNTT